MKFLRAGHDPTDPIDQVEFVARDLNELGVCIKVPQGWSAFFASLDDRSPSFVLETTTLTTPPLLVTVQCSLDSIARTQTQLKNKAQWIMRQIHRSHHTKGSIRRARHGQLSGYESTYQARQRVGRDVTVMDERLFYGHRVGKPLVILQATTDVGDLSKWDPMLRHIWGSVRYLSAAAVTAAIRAAKAAARKIRAKRRGP